MAMNLVELDVSSNNLIREMPEDFGSLRNLSLLFLYKNQLTGELPKNLGDWCQDSGPVNTHAVEFTGQSPPHTAQLPVGCLFLTQNPGC